MHEFLPSQMSSIRQYVSRQLAREMSESARDRDAVARLSSETTGLRSELHKLKSEVRLSLFPCPPSVFPVARLSTETAGLLLGAAQAQVELVHKLKTEVRFRRICLFLICHSPGPEPVHEHFYEHFEMTVPCVSHQCACVRACVLTCV